MNKILNILIEEFHSKLKEVTHCIPREFSFPQLVNKINIAIGMRRAEKTTGVEHHVN